MRRIRLAIAEGHPLLLEALVNMFDLCEDISVEIYVNNGETLLEEMEFTPVNVVLLDWRMPILDGAETLPIIKGRFPHIKVVMFTSNDEESLRRTFTKNGAHGFLLKGTDFDLICETVRNVLEV